MQNHATGISKNAFVCPNMITYPQHTVLCRYRRDHHSFYSWHSKCNEISWDSDGHFGWYHQSINVSQNPQKPVNLKKKTYVKFSLNTAPLDGLEPNSWYRISWWRHQMETFSALLALGAGNSPVTGEFPSQGPVRRSFAISLICALNRK